MTRRTGWCVAIGAVVLALTAAGCGKGGEDPPQDSIATPPSVAATATTGAPPGGATGAPPGGQGGGASDDGFSWVPFGPADANNPDGTGWFAALEERNCYSLRTAGQGLGREGGDPLVLALAAVCAAVIDGDQSQWAVAQQENARPRKRKVTCFERAGEAMLARALAWHAANPGRTPELTFPRAGEPVACAFEITKVSREGGGSDLPQGPVTGKTEIAITGSGLSEVQAVFIGGQPAQSFTQMPVRVVNGVLVEGVSAITPAAQKPGAVDVVVRNRAGEARAPLAFMYLAATATATQGPRTPSQMPPTGRTPTRRPPSPGPS